jgi:hypothetical protein
MLFSGNSLFTFKSDNRLKLLLPVILDVFNIGLKGSNTTQGTMPLIITAASPTVNVPLTLKPEIVKLNLQVLQDQVSTKSEIQLV